MVRAFSAKPEFRGHLQKNGIRDVVLLHGWGFSAAIWEGLARRLAPRFRVHAPDLPGYGAAPACSPYTLDGMAEAVSRAAPRRCHVVGWSLGGEVALAWARRAPRQVRRLALIGATPCFAARAGWPCGTPRAVLREFGRRLAGDRAGTLTRFIAAQGGGDARAGRLAGPLARAGADAAPDRVLAAGLHVLLAADLRGKLHAVSQPTLVLHGWHDRIVPPAAGRRLAAALPDARFELMRACGHAPFLSQPGQVAQRLREFLG